MPDVAVVIPAYLPNHYYVDWLKQAIESVLAQTFTNWELIVVDDVSPVDFPHGEIPGIRWIRHDRRRGPGAARNTAVAASTADWILPLDADDTLYSDGLAKLWEARCEHGVVYGDVEWIGERKGIHHTEDWTIQRLFKLTGLLPVTALHTRQAWRTVGGWNEELSALEDVEYWMRLAAHGICGKRIDAVTMQYRKHSDSRQSLLEQKKQFHAAVSGRIKHLHANLYSRLNNMAKSCSKCPGSAGPGNGVQFMTEGIADGVQLKYLGPLRGSFSLRGHVSGRIYKVGGKGAYVTIDPLDRDQFLGMQIGGMQNYVLAEVSDAPEMPVANMARLEDAPADDKPNITEMKAKEAIALIESTSDVLDLRIWLAEERASDAPRSTVVNAIEARLEELQPADG